MIKLLICIGCDKLVDDERMLLPEVNVRNTAFWSCTNLLFRVAVLASFPVGICSFKATLEFAFPLCS